MSDIDVAFHQLAVVLGSHTDIVFGIALLASGISSSSVGTMAGQVVMQGYLQRQIPLFVRRIVTMTPAFIVIAMGVNPTTALILSQVVLSFGIPFALIPLLWFCRDRALMESLVNRPITNFAATVVVVMIIGLNVFLLWSLAFG